MNSPGQSSETTVLTDVFSRAQPSEQAERATPDTAQRPSEIDTTFDRRQLTLLGTVVVLGALLCALDGTAVMIAMNSIGRDLNAPISIIQWVMTGYILAVASVIPITGWASERFGAKRVWIGALLLFIIASVVAGAAWSVGVLIASRILQGIAGGVLAPVRMAVLGQAAGPARMGRVMSIVGVPMVLGAVAGPMIGGLIVSLAGWRWIFFINLPIGIVAVLAARRLLPNARPQPNKRPDLPGLVLLPCGVGLFVYGMSEAGAGGGVARTHVLTSLAVGTVLIVASVVHARARADRATIDISLLRERGFGVAAATNFASGMAIFGVTVLLPLYWQIVRGESPLATGMLVAPLSLGAALMMPVAGWATDKIGARIVVPIGLLIACLGTAIYTQVDSRTSYELLVGAIFLIGVGMGGMNTPLLAAAYATLSHDAMPRATSALMTIKQLGGAIGTAALAVALDWAIKAEAPRLGGSVLEPLPPATRVQLAPELARAFATAFWLALALMAVAMMLALLLPGTKSRLQPARHPHMARDDIQVI